MANLIFGLLVSEVIPTVIVSTLSITVIHIIIIIIIMGQLHSCSARDIFSLNVDKNRNKMFVANDNQLKSICNRSNINFLTIIWI